MSSICLSADPLTKTAARSCSPCATWISRSARVTVPSDLEKAVNEEVLSGEITSEEAVKAYEHLKSAIEDIQDKYGWFPEEGAEVRNESELMDTDGNVYRPDRVVISGNKVSVIDFKFGDHHNKYERQVKKYADIWRRMGYADVSAFLWYVHTGEVRPIL